MSLFLPTDRTRLSRKRDRLVYVPAGATFASDKAKLLSSGHPEVDQEGKVKLTARGEALLKKVGESHNLKLTTPRTPSPPRAR